MPYGTQSKFFSSDMAGAPALYADAGAYVALLDAVLVNGYGAATISQIVVTDGMAVATTALGHKFRKWQVALNTGAAHAALNGEHRVIGVSGASYTFEVTGVPNGTYNGGETKVAPLGFEITATSANQRIYRSKDSRRNAVSLFVDDTNTVTGWNIGSNKALTQARLVCDVTDIGNYVTLGTTWWPKANAVSGTAARPWIIAGDALGFYSAVDVVANGFAVASSHFMQLNTLAAGDQFATMLEGASPTTDTMSSYANGVGSAGAGMSAMTMGARVIARGLAQNGAAIPMRYLGLGCMAHNSSPPFGWTTSGRRGGGAAIYQFGGMTSVNPADSGLVLGQNVIAVHSPSGLVDGKDFVGRAILPGLYSVPADSNWAMTATVQEAPGGMSGSNLLPLPAPTGGGLMGSTETPSANTLGGYYVDITKDWR